MNPLNHRLHQPLSRMSLLVSINSLVVAFISNKALYFSKSDNIRKSFQCILNHCFLIVIFVPHEQLFVCMCVCVCKLLGRYASCECVCMSIPWGPSFFFGVRHERVFLVFMSAFSKLLLSLVLGDLFVFYNCISSSSSCVLCFSFTSS